MKSCNTMIAVLVLAGLSGASGLSRFLGPPESVTRAKEDAMHMWAVADMELKEAKNEDAEAHDALNDGKAIEEVAADNDKAETARAKKELKGQDLDAALAVAKDEKASKLKDAKQIEDIAAKEQKDADATRKEGAQVRSDATAIETAVMPAKKEVETEAEKQADAKQMLLVADMEEHEADEERVKARDDTANSKAIVKAAALTAKDAKARAAKELKSKNDLAAADAVAEDEEKREDKDAKQIDGIATKESADAEATMKDATKVREDAAAIEAAAPKK